jgi:hypothetical protein
MTKYELVKKTEINGDVWYFIRGEDGLSIGQSWTRKIEEAENMLDEIQNGKKAEPIFETLKTIEIKEDAND